MKRTIKNVLMIFLIIVVGVCSYFTMKDVQENKVTTSEKTEKFEEGGTSPQMQEGDNKNNMGEPPERPDGDTSNMQEPPEKPDGDSNNMQEPSEKPDGDNNNMQEPPEKPDGDSNNMQEPPERPNGENNNMQSQAPMMGQTETTKTEIKTIHYIMFGLEGVSISILATYLVASKFNKLTLKQTLNTAGKAIIFAVVVIAITAILTAIQVVVTNKFFVQETITTNRDFQMRPEQNGNNQGSSTSVTKTGAITVDGKEETLTESYETSTSDESAILVQNGGTATIDGATISKSGGDSSNTENSEFYGVNAGILVTENSTATIKNAKITTNAKGSNAVFSTGTNSKIYVSDTTINTTGSGSSRGLDATYGGYIEADNVTIKTLGGSSATLATDRGEGTVIAKNSNLETNGSGSPVIYSTGDISIENTIGTANGSQMVVIEGKNSATVTNSTLTASGKGNRGDTDQAGIMIYQSMSGDAGQGTGTFTAKNSSLSIQESSSYYKTAPMFFITNTDAVINLNNTKLSYGSNILIKSIGTSEWGKSGSNGGNVTLNAENQELTGNIEVDSISTLVMNLSNSNYTGTINSENTAKSITLKLDSSSEITLTGDSYITVLETSDTSYSNINFNGYKLYVNGVAIN